MKLAQNLFSKLKACHHSAQRWSAATTLGRRCLHFFNPNGVVSSWRKFLVQPFQGWSHLSSPPRVARSSQPWAELLQPFRLPELAFANLNLSRAKNFTVKYAEYANKKFRVVRG
jgi:hypothetical protein